MSRSHYLSIPAIAFMAMLLAGCDSKSQVTLVPVTGQVVFGTSPPEGAIVVFVPVNAAEAPNALQPSGIVKADGTFVLSTHPHGAGAPPGEYSVVISWFGANARSEANPKNKLPSRYSEAGTTPLRATVLGSATTLDPFKLS
jgi:hypothetical protein